MSSDQSVRPSRHGRRRVATVLAAAALLVSFGPALGVDAAPSHRGGGSGHSGDDRSDKLLFFASDGMRQDAVEAYAKQGVVPGFRDLLKHGAKASDNGLLTQSPPNTGAGWYTLHDRRVARCPWLDEQHVPRQRPTVRQQHLGVGDGRRASGRDIGPGGRAGGKKVAQIEWAGGRSGAINGPTLDFRNFRSGRGVATNYISPTDSPTFTPAFGLQFDHPAGFAGIAPFPQAAPTPAVGWTNVPKSFSPPMEMRLRVIDGGVDKYGLNAYIYDSKHDWKHKYDRVLFSFTKDGNDKVANLKEGQWADVKVTINGAPNFPTDPLNGKTGAMLIKVERLKGDLSMVRLFHTSVTRAIATWPNWEGEPGFTGSFEDFVAERFASSQAGDFAVSPRLRSRRTALISPYAAPNYVLQRCCFEIAMLLKSLAESPANRRPGHAS